MRGGPAGLKESALSALLWLRVGGLACPLGQDANPRCEGTVEEEGAAGRCDPSCQDVFSFGGSLLITPSSVIKNFLNDPPSCPGFP